MTAALARDPSPVEGREDSGARGLDRVGSGRGPSKVSRCGIQRAHRKTGGPRSPGEFAGRVSRRRPYSLIKARSRRRRERRLSHER
jgi:hypothetical protein